MRKLNRKGVALLVVAIMVVLAVPMTLVYLNMGTSQKEQSMKFDSVLKIEQVTLSGINAGFSMLKSGENLGYKNLSAEISGDDRYDLNLTPSGQGFFQQDIYLMLSKSKDKDGKHNSIIMADAEQFPKTSDGDVNVITHDYWSTQEPYEIGVVADVISMRNIRGKDQLRFLDVKKYEMEVTPEKFAEDMKKLGDNLPPDVNNNWSEVVTKLSEDKIGNDKNPSITVINNGGERNSGSAGSNTRNPVPSIGDNSTNNANNSGWKIEEPVQQEMDKFNDTDSPNTVKNGSSYHVTSVGGFSQPTNDNSYSDEDQVRGGDSDHSDSAIRKAASTVVESTKKALDNAAETTKTIVNDVENQEPKGKRMGSKDDDTHIPAVN